MDYETARLVTELTDRVRQEPDTADRAFLAVEVADEVGSILRDVREAALSRMYRDGWQQKDVAKTLGISNRVVALRHRRWCAENGVELPQRWRRDEPVTEDPVRYVGPAARSGGLSGGSDRSAP